MKAPTESLPLAAVTGLGRGESPQPGAALVQSLRRRWPSLRIAGLAYDALESGIYAPDRPEMTFTIPYPFCGAPVLLERLDEIRRSFPFTVLIPTLDAEIEPWLALKPDLDARGISTLLPEKNSLKSRRKQDLPKLCQKAGVRTPRTIPVYTAADAELASRTLGGDTLIKGHLYEACRSYSPAHSRHLASGLLAEWGGPALVQEFVDGVELDVLALGDGKGGCLGACSIRKLVVSSKGKGYGGITIQDEELEEATAALMKELAWSGPLEFEFIRDKNDGLYLIEINPRFPAWADVPAALGCNLGAAALQQLMGWPVDPLSTPKPGKIFLRHNIDIICDSMDFSRVAMAGTTLHPNDLP